MADDSKVVVTLKLIGGTTFAAAAKAAGGELTAMGASAERGAVGIKRAGDEATVAEGKMSKVHSVASKLGSVMAVAGKGVGVAAAGVGIATAGLVTFAKSSLDHVKTLGESAAVLHGIAGLSNETAIQLAAVTDATGVPANRLGMVLKTLSTQAVNAGQGSKASLKAFADIGVPLSALKGTGGDVYKTLLLVAQGMDKTKGGAEKTAAAGKLLGRGWQSLNPVLADGGAELKSLTKFADSLGITLSGNTARNMEKARDASYRFHLVMTALQIWMVNKFIPTILDIAKFLNQHVIPAFKWFANAADDVYKKVKPVATAIGTWLYNAFNDSWPTIKKVADWLGNAATNVGNFLNTIGKSSAMAAFTAAVSDLAKAVSNVAQAWWWVITRMQRFVDMVSGPVKDAVNWLQGAASWVGNLLSGTGAAGVKQYPGGPPSIPNTANVYVPPSTAGQPPPGSHSLGGVLGALGLASGGVVHSQYQIVGERGPELAKLPYGTQITPAPLAQAMPQGPLYARLAVHLDSRLIHDGIYRVERALVEAS
jgi:hypothetical protein